MSATKRPRLHRKHNRERVNELNNLRRMIRELATCEWQGKDVTTKRLIFEARKLQGWSEAEIMR